MSTLIPFVLLAAILLGANGASGTAQDPPEIGRRISTAFPELSLRTPPEDQDAASAVGREFSTLPPSEPLAHTDWNKAHPIPIQGTDEFAWTAPSGEYHVCAAIPDPVDGHGAGCVTLDDIDAGHGFTFLSSAETVRVFAFVPIGESGLTVRLRGDETTLRPQFGAVATELPLDAVISSDHAEFALSRIVNPGIQENQ
jgi:hypothetical protein